MAVNQITKYKIQEFCNHCFYTVQHTNWKQINMLYFVICRIGLHQKEVSHPKIAACFAFVLRD